MVMSTIPNRLNPLETYLQHTSFDHNLHPIGGDASGVIYGILEDGGWKIGVELDVVGLSCVFNMDGDGRHGWMVIFRAVVDVDEVYASLIFQVARLQYASVAWLGLARFGSK